MSVLDDASNRSLAGSAFIQANKETYDAVKDMLDLMGLPDAPRSAHLYMENSDRLYLEKEGVAVVLVYDHGTTAFNRAAAGLGLAERKSSPVFLAAQVKTDLVLQPLFAMDLTPRCRFEIVPGIPRVSVTPEGMKNHADRLAKEGISFINPHPEIMGEIRAPNGERHLVAANRRRVGLSDKSFLPGVGAPMQEETYGELGAALGRAFESGERQKIQTVFAHFARINALPDDHPDKILHTPWVEVGHRSTELQHAAFVATTLYTGFRQGP